MRAILSLSIIVLGIAGLLHHSLTLRISENLQRIERFRQTPFYSQFRYVDLGPEASIHSSTVLTETADDSDRFAEADHSRYV